MAVAFVIFLLASAAAHAAKIKRADSECSATFLPVLDETHDSYIEECLKIPEIAAVADGFEGPEDDRKLEVFLQCASLRVNLFTDGALDPKKVEERARYLSAGKPYEASIENALAICDSKLLESYQMVTYVRCLETFC